MRKAPQEKYSRPPIGRMKRIDEWIRSGKYPNAVTMGRQLEVTDRTVKRDIEYMRDALEAPVEYDELKHGYCYNKPYDFLPVAAVTEAEMFALLVADKAIAQYRGMPFQKPLRMAFKKLTGQLDGSEQYSLENLGLAVSFRPFAPEDADLNAFRVITKGLQERRTLKFDYRNLGTKNWQARRVHPYHLACIDSHWYLFAHDVSRGAIRTFALSRLAKPAVTAEHFEKPKDFDPDKYLEGSFTVMKGDKEQEVVIEFDAWAADLVRGRQWHSSQEMTDRPDHPEGGLTLRMRLNSLEEIERWVLSWGTHAKVVEPAALRERVRKTAAAVAGRYA
jgi:predicted DNA-binding transcriptional regulator YafY